LEEDLATGTMRPRSTKVVEYFRKGTENLPFCSVHSGMAGDGVTSELSGLPALDVVPVRPVAPVLIGDDPYHTEVPRFAPVSGATGLIRKRINVLDSLDIGDKEEGIFLRPPGRTAIEED
jgi:penicillin-binding protein 1A